VHGVHDRTPMTGIFHVVELANLNATQIDEPSRCATRESSHDHLIVEFLLGVFKGYLFFILVIKRTVWGDRKYSTNFYFKSVKIRYRIKFRAPSSFHPIPSHQKQDKKGFSMLNLLS
jgi:hypothetical protein